MVRILHVSDPHAQAETMQRLHNLALAQTDCDVVAVTGDCVSQSCRIVPVAWNEWPQTVLLSVPGNHDTPNTFDHLGNWVFRPPYIERFADLIFVGLDPTYPGAIENEIEARGCREWEGCSGVVVLCHYGPEYLQRSPALLQARLGFKILLWLHGHDHPSSFSGFEWDDAGIIGDSRFSRSRVCSSVSNRRGLGHRIE